jgi:hypothetical protein
MTAAKAIGRPAGNGGAEPESGDWLCLAFRPGSARRRARTDTTAAGTGGSGQTAGFGPCGTNQSQSPGLGAATQEKSF